MVKKAKIDKDALTCQTFEKLCSSSETWRTILENASTEERVFLLRKKKDIDRLVADYRSLTA